MKPKNDASMAKYHYQQPVKNSWLKRKANVAVVENDQ